MRRTELIEIHDHPRFPRLLRNLVTDALEALWQFGNSYKPVLPRLHRALVTTGSSKVLDLCSGGGGPWLRLAAQLHAIYACSPEICLTDKYPNHEAFTRVADKSTTKAHITFLPESIDAMHVPPHLPDQLPAFRTMFSAFHHFGPEAAHRVLANAVNDRCGIAIFEVAKRAPKTLFILCVTPLLVLALTPAMRPFRWLRLLFTYLVPIIPFVIWYDGWASCLRAYSASELHQLAAAFPTYTWQTGDETTGLLPVTYLIGIPSPPAR